MIRMSKILSGKCDAAVTPRVTRDYSYITRGNDLRSERSRTKCELCKYYFTNKALNI